MKKLVSNLTLPVFIMLLAISVIPGLGLYDFYTRGEAREALMVQDIVVNGAWVLPRGYDLTISTKPPLFHWVAAAFSMPFGSSEFSIRLSSAFFYFASLVCFLFILRRELNSAGRWIFVVILAFSFEWLRAGLSARVDMAHAATLSLGIVTGYYALRKGKFSYWAATSIFIGLAVLGKGPVALVLSGGILGVFALYASPKRISSIAKLSVALGISLLIGGSWYVAGYLEAPTEFWEFFEYESVARFTSTMEDSPHYHSIPYFLLMFFLGALPFSPFLLWLVFKNSPKSKSSIVFWLKEENPLFLLSILSIVVIVIFYCIPSSKRGVYLLAAYPFIALAASLTLQRNFGEWALLKIKFAGVVGCAVVLAAQAIVLPLAVASSRSERKIAGAIGKYLGPNESVFSYGFEFYGASFYAEKTFHGLRKGDEASIFKLKEQLKLQPSLKAGDVLITIDSEIENAKSEVAKRDLILKELERLKLGRKTAIMTEVEAR